MVEIVFRGWIHPIPLSPWPATSSCFKYSKLTSDSSFNQRQLFLSVILYFTIKQQCTMRQHCFCSVCIKIIKIVLFLGFFWQGDMGEEGPKGDSGEKVRVNLYTNWKSIKWLTMTSLSGMSVWTVILWNCYSQDILSALWTVKLYLF